eukprot:m.234011 g.234011  ORF g.234011 m.234011 type:complete len:175 (+) comp40102_c3_seq5:901-1425(+)
MITFTVKCEVLLQYTQLIRSFLSFLFKMSKPVVFVIGASGFVGVATVRTLSAKYADTVDIRAGVRDPEKATSLQGLSGTTVTKAHMGEKDELVTVLKGAQAAFIVTPGHADRVRLAINAAEAAKEAGVKFLLVVSVLTAELTDSLRKAVQRNRRNNIEVGSSLLLPPTSNFCRQ